MSVSILVAKVLLELLRDGVRERNVKNTGPRQIYGDNFSRRSNQKGFLNLPEDEIS